ncbi:MAG: class I SAM-dependent methyltransferase [Chloroflexi bacterium]|nr:class I SAM-dependent methyltransferase [Chloroflexota bacterium]
MLSKVKQRLFPKKSEHLVKDEQEFLDTSKAYWREGYLNDSRGPSANSPESYFSSNAQHFRQALSIIERYKCRSFLEVGCNAGRNLQVLASLLEGASIHGVDINKEAIAYLRNTLPRSADFRLDVADVTEVSYFSKFPDKSIDCVFTSSVLIHIPPGEIKRQIIEEMVRIKSKILLLIEAHTDGEVVLDNRKDATRSPFCLDNYRPYLDGKGILTMHVIPGETVPYRIIVLE